MEEKRATYRFLVGNPGAKRPVGRPRRRWVANIKMNLVEIGLGGVDLIGLTQDSTVVNAEMNLQVP
jgi:hypothetical protein